MYYKYGKHMYVANQLHKSESLDCPVTQYTISMLETECLADGKLSTMYGIGGQRCKVIIIVHEKERSVTCSA